MPGLPTHGVSIAPAPRKAAMPAAEPATSACRVGSSVVRRRPRTAVTPAARTMTRKAASPGESQV